MGPKINLKARIERHSRVLAQQKNQSFSPRLNTRSQYGYKLVSMIIILLMPIYPVFSSFVNDVSELEFSREYIDEDSIISSYFGTGGAVSDGEVFIQSKDSFLYINAPIENERDVTGSSKVLEYTVKEGESFAFIAQKFNISKDSIYWANDFASDKELHPGNIIKIPPVSGVVHTVKEGDTLSAIAEKYDIEEEKIMRQNLLLSAADLKADATLIIPGAKKEIPQPVLAAAPASNTSSNTSTNTVARNTGTSSSQYVNTGGRYNLVWRKPYSGAPGNCTWYVASHKNVNWRGNANQWLRNARAAGHATGYNPSVGAIVQFQGRGYNPYYGHVGIVIDVTSTHIIVSDMNYRRKYEVTTRKVPINDRAIQGYIYVD